MTLSLPELGQKCWGRMCGVVFWKCGGWRRREKGHSTCLFSLSLSLPFLCCFQDGGSHVRSPGLRASVACQRSYLLVDWWEQAMWGGHILWPSAHESCSLFRSDTDARAQHKAVCRYLDFWQKVYCFILREVNWLYICVWYPFPVYTGAYEGAFKGFFFF